jgi:tetratricopeptide (TPR) repeat protein
VLRSQSASSAPFGSGPDIQTKTRKRERTLRVFFICALIASALVAWTHDARAQMAGNGENSIYGEFKVDETKAGAMVPISFVLVLMSTNGETVDRQSVMNNSRYRFLDLKPGFYDIVVESAGMQVARIRVQIAALRRQELKQDIFLEWDNLPSGKPRSKKGTVSTDDYYQRTPANQGLYDRAASAIKKKKFDEAAMFLQKVVEADPKDYLAWTDLGTMYFALNKTTEAESSYTHALAERPDLLAAAINLGRLRVAGKNFDRAIEVLRPAVDKHPESADANYLLGEASLQARKFDDAVNYFMKALKLEPQGKAEAHVRLAMLYDAAKRKDMAADELEQYLAKRPDSPDRERFEKYIKENRKR